jgi:hypothetical protein
VHRENLERARRNLEFTAETKSSQRKPDAYSMPALAGNGDR